MVSHTLHCPYSQDAGACNASIVNPCSDGRFIEYTLSWLSHGMSIHSQTARIKSNKYTNTVWKWSMRFDPCHSSLDPLWNSRFSAVFVIPACAPFASRSYIQHPPGWLTPLWLGVRIAPKSSCFQVRQTHHDTFWVSLFCTSCIYSRRQGFLAREKQAGLTH